MKRTIIITGIVLLLLIAGGLVWLSSQRTSPSPSEPNDPFGFNGGTNTPGDSTSSGNLNLKLNDDSTISVPDFTKTDQPDWAGPEAGYQVAGSVEEPYLVTYILPDPATGIGEFQITILAEPLGENRRAAEQEIKEKLGISEAQMCQLMSSVRTGPGVSETYEDVELGFSNCPGAVKLP